MNNLVLEADTLKPFHTGLAQRFDGYKLPEMNFASKVSTVEQNLQNVSQEGNFNFAPSRDI